MAKQKKIDLEHMTEKEKMKYEIADELGLLDRVLNDGWRSLTAKETGRIGGLVLSGLAAPGASLQVIALAPDLESLLVAAQRAAPHSEFPFEPGLGARLVDSVLEAARPRIAAGAPVVLVTQPGPRRALWRLLRPHVTLPVLGFPELQDQRAIEVVAIVGADAAPAEGTPSPMEPA